jgi:hypothetical protein
MNLFITTLMFLSLFGSAKSYAGPVWVEPYAKRDGSTVNGHWRSDPNTRAPLFSPLLYGNKYGYEVWIYINGESVASIRGRQASCGRGLTYYNFKKMRLAAEDSLNDCSSFLYQMAFSAGLNSKQADNFIKMIFTKQNCKFMGFLTETYVDTVYHRETMICNLTL